MFWLLVALCTILLVILIVAIAGNKVYDGVHKITERFDDEEDDNTENSEESDDVEDGTEE